MIMKSVSSKSFEKLQKTITNCQHCPRLRKHCQKIANTKRKAFMHETYWGRPICGFGDPSAQLILIGLAPAAHGANRTGRIFTGDRSGDWLYRALWKAGFANQAHSLHSKDGLLLTNAYVTCAVRCAPPDNKPSPLESKRCLPYLVEELELLSQKKVYVVLGAFALKALCQALSTSPVPRFGHAKECTLKDGARIVMSYHPSQQNTFTGRLTEAMFDQVFEKAKNLLKP